MTCPLPPNRLRGTTAPVQRDTVWVADITYVNTDEGFLYVAGVLDRCTRRCIGWAMGDGLATPLPLAALDMALAHRRPPAGLVHHSDRGSQYASAAYRQRLAQAGLAAQTRRPHEPGDPVTSARLAVLLQPVLHAGAAVSLAAFPMRLLDE